MDLVPQGFNQGHYLLSRNGGYSLLDDSFGFWDNRTNQASIYTNLRQKSKLRGGWSSNYVTLWF